MSSTFSRSAFGTGRMSGKRGRRAWAGIAVSMRPHIIMAKAKFRRMIDSSSGSEGATIEIRNVENKEQIGATFTYIVGAVNSPKQKFTPDSSRGFIAFWLESVRIIFHVEITEISEVL